VNGEKSQKESTPALPELVGGAPPSILKPGQTANAGDRGFDFDQIASGDVTGNVLQSGGYSLNTWEWNWAPWMQKFGQDIRRHWFAPYAYSLGVIDGMTRLEIVVERDGTCSSLEVQQTEGHESLEQSSVAAIRAAAPFLPLPRDFPEENLVIVLTLHYPAWKQLPPPRESQPQESDRTRRRR
jgi:TonB family protein